MTPTEKQIEAAMTSLFGKFNGNSNCHAWITPTWGIARERVADALTAALAVEAGAVGVKPLEWNPYRAETPFGWYEINDQRGVPESELKGRLPFLLCGSRLDYSRHASLQAAKAAAQADYEARIRSALTTSPASYECAARKQGSAGGNDPADCDWPFCGCDPHADKIIAALQECGWQPPSWEGGLTPEEQGMIDAAWEKHKAAAPASSGVEGVAVWRTMDSAPKDEEFIGRCSPEYKGFSCFWNGEAFVHYDADDGMIYYPVTEWTPFPQGVAAIRQAASGET